ncbi:MAG: Putrescine transport ATPbinding protein PotA [Rhodoferax sp.]|nr:Putrescine transport ATPbinding protein PotA [Rhodoferax sp.]
MQNSNDSSSAAHGGVVLAGLSKRYADGTTAVDNIDLRIEPGTYCCLLGPSGCGKTTMLRMIAGHETLSEGAILIDGKNVTGRTPRERGTAMMFQNYALFPHLSVRDNVAFALRVRGIDKKARLFEADRVIEQVQLTALANRLPGQLSGGQQQRVALARAIVMKPTVLLLDEPLSALDEFLRLQMRGELRSMQRTLGITFIHVTHTQLEAIAVADQVVVMDKGRIAQSASPRVIYAEPRTEYVAAFIGGQNVLHGEVTALSDAGVTLRGAQGANFLLPRDGSTLQTGQTVSFAVRRDRMQVTGDTEAVALAPNSLRGRVRELEYQGIYMKVSLTTEDPAAPGCVVYVEENTFFKDPVSVGQPVRCHWAADEAHGLAAMA